MKRGNWECPGSVPAVDCLADAPDASDCNIRLGGAMVNILCQIKLEYWKLTKHSKLRNGGLGKVLAGKIT